MTAITDLATATSAAVGDYHVISVSGVDKKITHRNMMGGLSPNVGIAERKDTTLNHGGGDTYFTSSVANYGTNAYVLVIMSWDTTLNNPFEHALYILGGIGGVYTAYKVSGGTNITASIAVGGIHITNNHASTDVRVVADLIQLHA